MRYRASHSVVCDAPPGRVYDLIRRTDRWPAVVRPCEAVTVLRSTPATELVEITARANGRLMTWQSERRFRPEAFGVDATIVQPMPLVADMSTTWRVVALDGERALLLLEHDYSLCTEVAGQVPGVTTHEDAARFIGAAIDANSTAELADFRAAAEAVPEGQRDFHLRHTVTCDAHADAVYDLVRDTRHWPRVFPACVGATRVGIDARGEVVRIEAVQDGRPVAWNTRRRYADAIRRIDYDLPVPMPLLASMSGQWRVVPLDGATGPGARCVLTVDRWWRVLDDVTGLVPGVGTPEEAAAFVRAWVGGNAAAEMVAIRASVEGVERLLEVPRA